MKKLDYVCVGFPKCGTYALWYFLSQHENVHALQKDIINREIYFFNKPNVFSKGIKWYQSLMLDHKINFEKTPSYILDQQALKKIKQFYPDVKIIVNLRNPIDYLISFYNHLRASYLINCKNYLTFDQFLHTKSNMNPNITYIQTGIFIKYLKQLNQYFDQKNIIILINERFKKLKLINELCQILKLPPNSNNFELKQCFKLKEVLFPKYLPPKNQIEQLQKYFEPHNQELFKYLGFDIPEWQIPSYSKLPKLINPKLSDIEIEQQVLNFCQNMKLHVNIVKTNPWNLVISENREELSNLIHQYLLKPREIPKIIHQIWLGPNKKPSIWMKTWSQNFLKTHPDWKYMLWTEKELSKITLINQDLFDQEHIYSGKSDILRYEILYQYGGIYIDADSVWTGHKSLNDLLIKAKPIGYFAAEEPKKNWLANGVIGCSKKHPNNLFLIYAIRPNYQHRYRKSPPIYAWMITGPLLFNSLIHNYHTFPIMIMPSTYFYPKSWKNIKTIDYNLKQFKKSYMFHYGYTTNNLHKLIK